MEKLKNINTEQKVENKENLNDDKLLGGCFFEQKNFFWRNFNEMEDSFKNNFDNNYPFSSHFLKKEDGKKKRKRNVDPYTASFQKDGLGIITSKQRRNYFHRKLVGSLGKPPLTFKYKLLGRKNEHPKTFSSVDGGKRNYEAFLSDKKQV